ncbi:MAG: DUF4846 domain-containing protein [Flavobacteriales bacterium]|nr:DUF4846 domain-containing protein [Flavobacteriales bacterium]
MRLLLPFTFISILLFCCGGQYNGVPAPTGLINPEGTTLAERIKAPEGYKRLECDEASFGQWLRNLKLKADGATVKLYTGEDKPWQHVHAAVVDMEIGNTDLQQCADACMRMRAEYLWSQQRFADIAFDLTNGFRMDYKHWRDGYRLKVDGNRTWWEKTTGLSIDYASFRNYLDRVFMFAGTLSLQNEMPKKDPLQVEPGDVFVWGGSPGHASMVVDVAVDSTSGDRIFLLAQGYMPAQEIHIILNPNDQGLSPWYSMRTDNPPRTMEWTFPEMQLRTWE